ncbi:ABC transporter permease [Pseudaestuariivita rosea]|uniref:ABC transporter permease n=1 Tax=Pseudaestuariivita rosea TaxID=2763263 RepID=UPI001ABA139E|nr:ABC transporter permease [Pseudaestuariivita rosea]
MHIYIFKRVLMMIPTLILISIVAFLVIQLPPGDFLTALTAGMEGRMTPEEIAYLRERYGLNDPMWLQYWKWISGIVFEGDFGYSFQWRRPVSELIWSHLGLTVLISFVTLLFVWAVSFPIGVLSAVRQYSFSDYFFTFIGFIGLATPNFLLALVLMYVGFKYFGQSVGGLFSPEYQNAPWSWAKLGDLMAHLWIPIIVIGTAKTAELIRVMRANLLDELHKPYVATARSKGLGEMRTLIKYPIRIALNPFISTIGWVLPSLVSGAVITAVVLNLPTTGPLLLGALRSQDMYLAGSFILMLSTLTVVGTLISDILLAWLDPRIRYQ